MDPTTTKKLISEKAINGTFHVLEKADHNLFLDNPKGLIEIIVKDVFG